MLKHTVRSRHFTRALGLFVSLSILALSFACSSDHHCLAPTGSFTNASLGTAGTQWAYEVSGWVKNSSGGSSPYTAAGTLIVDGNGNITGGMDQYWGSITSGTYTVSNTGTGTINLNTTNSQTGSHNLVWGITLANASATSSPGSFGVIEADSSANSAGAAYQQDATVLNNIPSGTFVFRTHTVTPSSSSIAGAQDSVGSLTFSGSSIINGSEDWVNGGLGTGQLSNFSGAVTPPSAGIGTMSFTDGLGARTFDYFVLDASDLLLFETDATNLGRGLGRAEAQQLPSGGFTNASFSGGFVFGGRGDTSTSGAGGINSVGQLSADGNGNVTGGSLDSVRDGTAQLGQTLVSGTYSVATNGRMTTTLNTAGGGGATAVLYLVSSTRAFFLISNDLTLVEDGTADQQSASAFTSSTFNGQYALLLGGEVSGVPLDRTGTLQADGHGNLGWNEIVNSSGSQKSTCSPGTYTVTANGRVAASVGPLSNSLVFYLISPNSAYALQGDSGAQVPGALVNQDHQVMLAVPGFF